MNVLSRIILGVVLGSSVAAGSTSAAEIERRTIGGVPVILIAGQLVYGDERKFADVALGLGKAMVLLSGPGGNLQAGLEIGKAVRLKGFTTVVPKFCASACALAWLGGQQRLVAPGARVGFHAAWERREGRNEVAAAGNAVVGAYLSQIGLSTPAILYLTQAGPNEVNWLTPPDARRLGIEANWVEDKLPAQTAAGPTQQAGSPDHAPSAYRPSGGGQWSGYGEWVQVASRKRFEFALPVAEIIRQRNANTSVFLYDNGWSVVVVGPFSPGRGQVALNALVAAGEAPQDSIVVTGDRFVALQWGQVPRRKMTFQVR
ncbi:hypothetical protein SAMN04488144_1312 [Methylobacterium sp. 190mf]|uniref:hypothetical protein n=1 Tax=Methylobacterium sp. 190mf TaxID=1761798 RepID=UPI00089E2850|nr:hypothetical protein [Methylobacterium sp. 190mf]SEG63704.1 hypothetical protein SAMN04488144_1312 [Methylobacterium sp. 190mf]